MGLGRGLGRGGPVWYGSDIHMVKMVFGSLSVAVSGIFVMANLTALLNPPKVPAIKAEDDD